jgi:N-formylglutamate amidohydrolase
MARAAVEIISPRGPRVPLVAHIPHASTVIPDQVRAELLVSHAELADELLHLTDWYTDELFAGLRDQGATLFINRLSRLVFDPERFLDDSAEPMAPRGQGVVYWLGSQLQLLREASTELRARRVRECYRPYHAALDSLVGELLAEFGECSVVDCHSFATEPLRSEIDGSPDRPDICIGTDPGHTSPEVADALEAAFTEAGFRVARDVPFAGTFVPSGYYGRDERVRSVMIEVRRGLYLDEASAVKSPAFDSVAATISRVVGSVMARSRATA